MTLEIVMVKRSLSLKKEDVVSAQASFRTAMIGEDCYVEQPLAKEIDWFYMGPIIATFILSLINLILFCVNNRQVIVQIRQQIH